jgi:hypothetical protein
MDKLHLSKKNFDQMNKILGCDKCKLGLEKPMMT